MPECFRTKATVEDGIVNQDGHADVVIMDYQPGNGTRYELVFTRIPGTPVRDLIFGGWGTRGVVWMVHLKNCYPKRSTIFVETGTHQLHWRNIATADDTGFGIGPNDAVCLTEIIAHVTRRPCQSCAEMTKDVLDTLAAREAMRREG